MVQNQHHLQNLTAKTSKTAKENDILDFVEIVSQMAAPGMKIPVEIPENLCRSLAPMLPSSPAPSWSSWFTLFSALSQGLS